MTSLVLKKRDVDKDLYRSLVDHKVNKLIAKLLAARNVKGIEEYNLKYEDKLSYTKMKNLDTMVRILVNAIKTGKKLLILSDYDADGGTACVIGYTCLKAFGANVGYLIPKRLVQGYGLTTDIAEIACSPAYKPDYIITVDNGISSFDGIDYCNSQGVKVLVTDHHQAGSSLPNAEVIVNPNQPGCEFPSKALAGCGVIFYVMWALQDALVEEGIVFNNPTFDVDQLLPILAVGTIADVVPLDVNNRTLIKAGLERIWKGKCSEGLKALIKLAGKRLNSLTTMDIAFQIGPRINAAGRLETMDKGVECLLCEEPGRSMELALSLQSQNESRKEIEAQVSAQAVATLEEVGDLSPEKDSYTIVVANESWHQGVVGIVAGRLKEKHWRPTFVFTKMGCEDGEMKGSGRCIEGMNLRDALDEVSKLVPGVLVKFGGHAMAAGATIVADRFEEFKAAFETVARKHLTSDHLNQVIAVDGKLPVEFYNIADIAYMKEYPWGQLFPAPTFCDIFDIKNQKLISDGKHLKLVVTKDGKRFDAVVWRQPELLKGDSVKAVFKLDVQEFRGESSVQIIIEHIIPD